MYDGKKCGCKGIRTCLLCEHETHVPLERKIKEVRYTYVYCPECNLCWPDNEETTSLYDFPLYLGKLKLHVNFFTEEEETVAITAIDEIPWMPSQSGRRKQDFGPKVNFKKKKVKIGEFKGFPRFTESILRKFPGIPELSDFQPVELCHLEYSPERGSSIDPHVDDFWLWGERLVTINLGSSTVLTLVPCSGDVCECSQQANLNLSQPQAPFNENGNENFSCTHELQEANSVETSVGTISAKDIVGSKNSNGCSERLGHDAKSSKLHQEEFSMAPKGNASDVSHSCSADQLSHQCRKMLIGNNSSVADSSGACEMPNSLVNEDAEINCHICQQKKGGGDSSLLDSNNSSKMPDQRVDKNVEVNPSICQQKENGIVSSGTSSPACICAVHSPSFSKDINTMCNVFRTGVSDSKVAVRVILPPRSLLVLAGCARYNWFHEIKRQDVVSRRLAMTFRELTSEFLDGGKESQIGEELIVAANNFL